MFSLLQQHLILGEGDLMCCNKNYPVLKVLQEEGFRLLGLATYLLQRFCESRLELPRNGQFLRGAMTEPLRRQAAHELL